MLDAAALRVAQYCDFYFSSCYRFFHEHLVVLFEKRQIEGSFEPSLTLTLLMPTDEPEFAGFTKSGYVSVKETVLWPLKLSVSVSVVRLASQYPCISPDSHRFPRFLYRFRYALSIDADDAVVSDPMKGIPAISMSPCIVPSSPFLPWSTGNITSVG